MNKKGHHEGGIAPYLVIFSIIASLIFIGKEKIKRLFQNRS